jgi:hypothetical protein
MHATMLAQKKSPISLFNNLERHRLFNELTTTGVYVRQSVFGAKGNYKIFEERFNLTDIFPRLLDK